MDSTSSTAIAGTFLLAEAGALLYAQMPRYHDKITRGGMESYGELKMLDRAAP